MQETAQSTTSLFKTSSTVCGMNEVRFSSFGSARRRSPFPRGEGELASQAKMDFYIFSP
jgi:hypothetical protein